MNNNTIIKISMSISYAIALTIMFFEIISKPLFSPILDIVAHETSLSIQKILVISSISTFLFGLTLLYFQVSIYVMFLKLLNVSVEQQRKVFPSVVLSMCLVTGLFLLLSLFINITNSIILSFIPVAILLLNSLLLFALGKDKKAFLILFVISIIELLFNGLIK
ncbi:MAG: hypothetical protein ACK5NA_08955, partial [Enterococcus sp.]